MDAWAMATAWWCCAVSGKPPSYYSDKLMKAPVGHFFDVITNGFGAMPSYASRVEPDDRWRITAYIRALQFSESAKLTDVPADQRQNCRWNAAARPRPSPATERAQPPAASARRPQQGGNQ